MSFYPPGSLIANRYEIASRPLMGGMGIVYLCMDTREDRPVALKTFKPEFLPNRAARDRFLREGDTWSKLGSHPHIVRCFGVERIGDGREVFLVLELVAKAEGHPDASLRAWLAPGQPIPPEQALLFALQAARAMQHATSLIPGLVHRDLKPENLLVGADRLPGTDPAQLGAHRLRVTDFGLAHTLEEAGAGEKAEMGKGEQEQADRLPSSQLGRTQLTRGIVGTPRYMAPEQWLGQPVSCATDVYALGCMFYEMLTGQWLAGGRSLAELERQHCAGRLPPLPESMPNGVKELLADCLAPQPEQRLGDWQEVEARLADAYRQTTVWEAPPAVGAGKLSRAEQISLGWGYINMGHSYLDIGKAEAAIPFFEQARAIGEAQGEPRLAAAGLTNLGLAYAALGDPRRAIGCYEQALVIDREIGDRSGEGVDLGNLGIAYNNLGDARGAIGLYEQALAIAHQINDRIHEGTFLCNLGTAYRDLGDTRRAIGCYEQALVIAREIGNRGGEGAALGNLGSAYIALGDDRRAIGLYDQALIIAREIGNRRGEGGALGNLGIAYRHLGDPRRAVESYEQALAIDREIGDRRNEGVALGNLGVAYAELGDTQRAIRCYELQLTITREISDRRSEGNALGNLGNAYTDLGDTKRAVEFYQQALQIIHEIGDIVTAGMLGTNLAMSLAQAGQIEQAIPIIKQAIQDFYKAGVPHHAQKAEKMLTKLQTRGATPNNPAIAANSAQATIDAFLRAASPTEMQAVVQQHPILASVSLIQAIENYIKQQVPPEQRPAFEQRLAWLRKIATS